MYIVLFFASSRSLKSHFTNISPDVPGPVLDLKPVVVTRKLMMLNWSDPDDDGGSDITGFIIERREPKMHTWRQPIDTPASKCEIVGIIEGQEYIFRVVAKNKYGCGPPVDLGPILAVDPQGNLFIHKACTPTIMFVHVHLLSYFLTSRSTNIS